MTAKMTKPNINIAAPNRLTAKPKARLGLINYINSLPFVLPIVNGWVTVEAETVFAQPAELNALYAHQELELGAMSAFSFLQQANLKLMPGIAIASRAAVGSVLFFSKVSLETRPPLRIAVPAASATAINLLLLLLLEQGLPKPVLIPLQQPNLSEPNIDAALIIGDQALMIDQAWSRQYWRRDLGQWWYDIYSLPAVFGVFAAREDWYAADNSHAYQTISETLNQAAKLGLTEYFEKVLDEAEAKTGLPRKQLSKYFKEELDYSLNSEHQLSLNKYEALCQQHSLLDKKTIA